MAYTVLKVWERASIIGKAGLLFRYLSYIFCITLIVLNHKDNGLTLSTFDYAAILVFFFAPFLLFLQYIRSGYRKQVALRHSAFDFFSVGLLITLLNYALYPSIIFIVLIVINQIAAQGFRKLHRMLLVIPGSIIPYMLGHNTIIVDTSEEVTVLASIYAAIHVIILSYASYSYAKALKFKNIKVEDQREEIRQQSEELKSLNDSLMGLNRNLEKAVEERTKELQLKNEQLAEYAFINAHKLRAPISTLQGLLNLLEKDQANQELILAKVKESMDTLVMIVTDIRVRLEHEDGTLRSAFD